MADDKISVAPLIQWIAHVRKTSEAAWCKSMSMDQARLTNWKKRGIPFKQLPKIAAEMGIDTDEYLSRAGRLPEKATKQRSLDGPAVSMDFDALPVGLQAHVAKTVAELRRLYESFPPASRALIFTPPKDLERYAEWERSIEALFHKFKGDE